jgi:2-oxoglutarate ferredoxin oxidoreductase subunit beta
MNNESEIIDKKLFKAQIRPNWCPGCGDYSLLQVTIRLLAKLGYKPNEVVITSGIGCSSSFPHWTSAYGVHMLHGRALPAAMGIKMVNPALKVIAVGGDGDGYGIGVGHFVHTARKNLDMLYMVMNNQIYGLTMGQSSPSSQVGHTTITSPEGVDEHPINPIALALGAGATFVARGFSGDNQHLSTIIEQALNHKGFAFIDVLSPCVTFNRLNTYDWFRERVYRLEETDYDPFDIGVAFSKSQEWGEQIPLGLFFKTQKATVNEADPVTRSKIPINEPLGFKAQGIDTQSIIEEFR